VEGSCEIFASREGAVTSAVGTGSPQGKFPDRPHSVSLDASAHRPGGGHEATWPRTGQGKRLGRGGRACCVDWAKATRGGGKSGRTKALSDMRRSRAGSGCLSLLACGAGCTDTGGKTEQALANATTWRASHGSEGAASATPVGAKVPNLGLLSSSLHRTSGNFC